MTNFDGFEPDSDGLMSEMADNCDFREVSVETETALTRLQCASFWPIGKSSVNATVLE